MKTLPSATELFLVQHLAVRELYEPGNNLALDDFFGKCPSDVTQEIPYFKLTSRHTSVTFALPLTLPLKSRNDALVSKTQ